MALGPPAPQMDPFAVLSLLQKLRLHWGHLSDAAKFFLAPGNHANSATHLVLLDPTGTTIGLKAADRGLVRGTKIELVVSHLARVMSLSLAPQTHLLTKTMVGLGVLSNRATIATEWYQNTEVLDKLPPAANTAATVRGVAAEFLHSYGEWLAFGLAIATRDRNAGNWVCSDDGRTIGMIDLEDSLGAEARPEEDLRIPLVQFGLFGPLKTEPPRTAGGLRSHLERGLRDFHRHWFSVPNVLRSALSPHPWCAGYTNTWWNLDEDQFVAEVFRRLLT